ERLSDIHQQLETAGESDTRLTETFSQVYQSLQGMESHSSLQTSCLRNLESAWARHQQQLQELVRQQNRRLIWAAGLLGGLFLVAAILIAVAAYLGRLT
ncbi:MAG: hypothetical protein JW810_11280, partial [Sedimentisphaerales bacterium]|nr:hypothetical protein [Sedimentisphaerales bacterium]